METSFVLDSHTVEYDFNHDEEPLSVYACGPTVYSDAHIGHARTYICLDMIRRVITDYLHIPTIWTMNITDVDDKIISAFNSGQTGFDTIKDYTEDRIKAFFNVMNELNVRRPDNVIKVTDIIPDIIAFIEQLSLGGYAYPTPDGSVYFDVAGFMSEGFDYPLQNSHNDEPNKFKHSPADFALWKAAKPNEPFWDSPWGNGRPGWHTECATIINMTYNQTLDIHCGGIDLRFPHHANELAQLTAAHNGNFTVNHWLYTGQVKLNGEKMSKSLGNIKTINDFLKLYTPRQVRLAFAMIDRTAPIEMNEIFMRQVTALDKRIENFLSLNIDAQQKYDENLQKAKIRVYCYLTQEFDFQNVINEIKTIIDYCYRHLESAVEGKRYVNEVLTLLGLTYSDNQHQQLDVEQLARKFATSRAIMRDLLRMELKVHKSNIPSLKILFQELDKIRDEILPTVGIHLEDCKDGGVTYRLTQK